MDMLNTITYRSALPEDAELILDFIRRLAEYEKMADQVTATPRLLKEWIFEKQKAEVIFAMMEGKEVGFALFFHNFSTFLGKSGLYLEDLFVLPEYRGRGCGRGLLKRLAAIALERDCGRLEWWCLDWNKPAIDFYLSLGARPMEEWTVFRLAGDALKTLGCSETERGEENHIVNRNPHGNMLLTRFYVCPTCGNVLQAAGEAFISCCGIALPPLEPQEPDGNHAPRLEAVENEHYVRIPHPMDKEHFISFLAFVGCDRIQFVKLYPEGNADARLCFRGGGHLYWYCNRHGLMRQKVRPKTTKNL